MGMLQSSKEHCEGRMITEETNNASRCLLLINLLFQRRLQVVQLPLAASCVFLGLGFGLRQGCCCFCCCLGDVGTCDA
jgi:hypothetical protein